MQIITFNANGLRSAASKGFFDWFAERDADVLCVQETKAQEHQLAEAAYRPAGYHAHFRDASTRNGYSGVAIYSKAEPDAVLSALGWPDFDEEGRYIEARFGALSVVSLYFPSGSSGELRQDFKFRCMEWFGPILDDWLASGRDYIVCGDWNIVRSEQDIRNWRSNQKNSGCLPEERAWMNGLIERGWIDSYRHLRPDGEDYTWWSQRGAARAKDVGWRIDYQLVSPGLASRLSDCAIAREPKFSDHAPYTVDYL
ncbi:MAG TPA: exodeoxyribonuclease III [Xanthomonadales bacterium]|nr:exodeoxyribonuclease III [Xanthomonadales bacterium]